MAYLSDWKALDNVISAVSGVQAVVGIPSKLLKSGNQRELEKAIGAFERDLIIPKYETDQQKMKKGTRINLHKCNQMFCLPRASSEQCSDNNGWPHTLLAALLSCLFILSCQLLISNGWKAIRKALFLLTFWRVQTQGVQSIYSTAGAAQCPVLHFILRLTIHFTILINTPAWCFAELVQHIVEKFLHPHLR